MTKANKMTLEEIQLHLVHFSGWKLEKHQLVKDFKFDSFDLAVRFFNTLAVIAEELNHHPDFFNSYHYCRIALSTHDVGGITNLDFQFLERLESHLNSNPELNL